MNNQWHLYQQLEFMTEAVPPQRHQSAWMERFNPVYRSLTKKFINNLSHDKQIEHLEHSWKLDRLNEYSSLRFAGVFWAVCQQSLIRWLSTSREPEVCQVSDQNGQVWWYAHDPVTGQMAYLETEEEVQVWLEERLHYYH